MKRNNMRIFNQIDYILVKNNRRQSLISARSYINNHIDTDHRLVVTKIHNKMDYERAKDSKPKKQNEDEMVTELSKKQKELRNQIFQSTNWKNILKWKQERKSIFKQIKKRKAKIIVEKLLQEADEIHRAKDSAQAAIALKKIFKKPRSTSKMPSLMSLSE